MSEFNRMMGIFMLAAGVYIFYEYFRMVKTGKLSEVLLLGKGVPESRCRDKEAFSKKALPAVLILAVITTAYGVIDCINFFVVAIEILDFVFMIVFLVVLFGYAYYISKLKKTYIRPY
ncbi:MAG: hypothetical protein HFH53_07200 [Hespellia sp.]|nr:hypothetical protein [Hespellia sp.]